MKLILLLAAALIGSACFQASAKAQTVAANPDAVVLQDFTKRIEEYVALHKRAAKDVPTLRESDDPARIKREQDALAARIQAVRSAAKPGDIFTPEIRRKFRRLLAPEMKGEGGRDAREILKDDAPASFPLKVNAKYPSGAPLPTVPGKILASLPTLPEQLEYRVIGKHLILLDTKADIIVDFIPNAIV